MSAEWMVASTVVAMMLAGAALALARVAALYRGVSLRWVWMLATIASLAVSGVWLLPSSAPTVAGRAVSLGNSTVSGVAPIPEAVAAARPSGARSVGSASPAWLRIPVVRVPRIPRALQRTALMAWAGVSALLFAVLAVAAVRLRDERRKWRWQEVASTRVLVSRAFGPAIVGVLHPDIVLPEWVLALDAPSQRAIVTHEAEHRAAHDPALLIAGLAALVLMPWNIGLWMSWRGLRRAIELDCDARVVARGIADSEYAGVLLGAWRSAHGHWFPSTAFAERASGLGTRVEHLMRPEPRRRAMRTTIGALVAVGLVFVACATPSPQRAMPDASAPYPLVIIDGVPRPELPPLRRFTGAVVAETTTTPTYRITYHGRQVEDTIAARLYPSFKDDGLEMQIIDAPASMVHFGEAARYGAVLYYTKKYRDAGGALIAPTEGSRSARRADPATPVSTLLGASYNRMFNGIALAPDRAATARAVIEAENAAQTALSGPFLAIWPRRIALQATRDAELRALLTSDADRVTFDRHSLEGRMHTGPTIEEIVDSEYNNLFGWPDQDRVVAAMFPILPSDARARARAIIRTTINDEMVIYARAPAAWNGTFDERLALRVKRDADLRALLPTEAERAKFDRVATRGRTITFKRP